MVVVSVVVIGVIIAMIIVRVIVAMIIFAVTVIGVIFANLIRMVYRILVGGGGGGTECQENGESKHQASDSGLHSELWHFDRGWASSHCRLLRR